MKNFYEKHYEELFGYFLIFYYDENSLKNEIITEKSLESKKTNNLF